jgi:hypothetical protein
MDQTTQRAVDPPTQPEPSAPPYVPPIDEDQLARKNLALIQLLDSWDLEEEEEQRETMAVLRKALGEDRIASNRNLFP